MQATSALWLLGLTVSLAAGACSIQKTLLAGPAETNQLRILLVTGQDYPAHVWRETAPALRRLLPMETSLKAHFKVPCKIITETENTVKNALKRMDRRRLKALMRAYG